MKFKPTDAELAELEAKHGEHLRIVEDGDDRVFVFGKPDKPRPVVQRFFELRETKKLEAYEGLVKGCCVFPDPETLKKYLADEPALVLTLADACGELVGVRQLSVKK